MKQKGFTIIELLIALALGLFLSAGMVGLYIQSKNSFWQDEELARIQENGRYALQVLMREVRMGGFLGGVARPATIDPAGITVGNDCGANWALDAAVAMEIVNNAPANLGSTYSCFTSEIVPDTDVLAVKRVLGEAIIEDGELRDGYSSFVNNRIYLHSRNRGLGVAEFARGGSLSTTQDDGVNVWEYAISLFHVAENGNGIPSLARYTLNADGNISGREFLVEGVENMQFEMGIDTSGDGQPERYVAESTNPPSSSTDSVDITQVVAVRIYLLVRTLQPRANTKASEMTYKLGTKTITTNDNISRRVFSGTAMLRNPVYSGN